MIAPLIADFARMLLNLAMQEFSPLAPIRTDVELRDLAHTLKALPNFEGAVKRYTKDIVAFREAGRSYGKLIANEDRFRVINFFFPLWAESLVRGGNGALTYGELYEVCRRGEVTPRVLKSTLALAVHLGFLTRTPNPSDRRSWHYAPTDRMLRFPHQWMVPATVALDTLMPGLSLTAHLKSDPRLLIHFFRSAGREFDSGLQPQRLVPRFMHFSGHKEGGTLLAMSLLVAEMDGLPFPSRAEVAERFGLTKSQVTQLVATGVEMGFLSIRNGTTHPTDALREGHSEWVAVALAFLQHHLQPEAIAR
ncbi:DNA-binding MarR family transcriptional regulator [Devosia sp. UYZn731]|uniref:hypothetical protein n=1 Tax=Devosia sp. UYZn731 TaxID=3156345 RepID=UPI00339883D9